MAIDLHIFLKGDKVTLSPQQTEGLKNLSREVLANIAEGFSQRTAKAKRYFNFKALDAIRRMAMDLDFLHDVQGIPSEEYEHINKEYEICAAQIYKLNQSILSKQIEKESAEPVKA